MSTKIKGHFFEISGGESIKKGKTHWPDCITVQMDRFYAWEVVKSLIAQLEDEKRDLISFGSCGKLDYNIEEQ